MPRADGSDYGSRLLDLWRADLCDRLHGERARANARWGVLRPPPGRGRLVWVMADASRDSVRLGADVLAALHEKRLDVRLVLSFERQYPELIARARGLSRSAVGYGPADAPSAVRRALQAFAPLGVVFVRRCVPPNLAETLAAHAIPAVALNAQPSAAGRFAAVYPANRAQALAWGRAGNTDYIALPADFLTLLVEGQVEPGFRRLVAGGKDLCLWWVHGLGRQEAVAIATAWRASPLSANGILLLGPAQADATRAIEADIGGTLRLSHWGRTPMPPGTVALLDEERWLPAVAASARAVHLCAGTGRWALWQALAGGAPVSLADPVLYAALDSNGSPEREVMEVLAVETDPAQVLRRWQDYATDTLSARRAGDRTRRIFWNARRRAQAVSADFLQRVYDW